MQKLNNVRKNKHICKTLNRNWWNYTISLCQAYNSTSRKNSTKVNIELN